MRRRRALWGIVLAAAIAGGCEPADPKQQVAEEFIERLFVAIDQTAARELATGLAAEKIDEEIRLKGDLSVDASARKPSVTYELLETRGASSATRASLVYELDIAPDGADGFTRHLLLGLRQTDGAWQVSNYSLAVPPGGD